MEKRKELTLAGDPEPGRGLSAVANAFTCLSSFNPHIVPSITRTLPIYKGNIKFVELAGGRTSFTNPGTKRCN